jgi:C_GCAxxG_C_C family probable redox protein
MSKIDDWAPRIRGPRELAAYDGSTTDAERRAKRLDAIAKAAYNNLRAYSNCCRSTLWALQTHLRLGGDDPLKASATLAGGIAGTGETCGAVIGALMGLGLGIASADVQELDRYVAARDAARRFVERFTERFGSTRCYELQEAIVGWRCDDPSLADRWLAADGPIACAAFCAEAARIAAELILDHDEAP